jgi:acyl dehydratase
MSDFATVRERARMARTGRRFEDFRVGDVFAHHWGRTITESDNIAFATLTLSYTPLYFNAEYAKAEGHDRLVVAPMLVFLTVFGLSVEDLSEGGGPFLGVDELTYHRPVLVGETVYARSTVRTARESTTRPGSGIVSWRTEGLIDGEVVVDFVRSNLVRKRGEDGVL